MAAIPLGDLVTLGCASAEARRENAVLTLSSWHYCPGDRIAATVKEAPVPAEVAADPERLTIWRREHTYDGTYVAVEGCGKSEQCVCGWGGGCRRYRP